MAWNCRWAATRLTASPLVGFEKVDQNAGSGSEMIKPKVFDPSHQRWQSIGAADEWLTTLKAGLGCEKQSRVGSLGHPGSSPIGLIMWSMESGNWLLAASSASAIGRS